MNKQKELLEAVEKLMRIQKANHAACNPITWGNLYHGDEKPEWLVLSEMIPQRQLFFFDTREEMPPFKHFKYSDELAEKIQSRKKKKKFNCLKLWYNISRRRNMFTQDKEMKLENKLFIVGSTKSKGSVDLNRILVTTELAYDYSPALLNKYSMEEILKPLDTKEILVASITLAQKIVRDMKLDDMFDTDDKSESFRFSFGKYPLIQLSQPHLSEYYTHVYSKFIDNILTMKHSTFMDREKFDAVVQEAMGNLERIFIWHIDFDSPMTLDMYLKCFAETMDTDEDNMFNIYVYDVYDIEPSVIRLFPWYDIKKVDRLR